MHSITCCIWYLSLQWEQSQCFTVLHMMHGIQIWYRMGWSRRVMRSAIRSIRLSLLQCPRRQPFCMKKYPWHTFFIWLPVSRWYLSSWRAGFMRKRKKHRTIIPGSSIVRISGKDFIIWKKKRAFVTSILIWVSQAVCQMEIPYWYRRFTRQCRGLRLRCLDF